MPRFGEDYHHFHSQPEPSAAYSTSLSSWAPSEQQRSLPPPRWSSSASWFVPPTRLLALLLLLTVALQPALARALDEEGEGSGDGGKGGDFSVDMYHIPKPFQFVETPRDMQVIEERAASFFCHTSDAAEVSVQWRKNGQAILPSSTTASAEDVPGGSVLTILPKMKDNNATFECVAENALGDTISAQASLTVYEDNANAIPEGFPQFRLAEMEEEEPDKFPVFWPLAIEVEPDVLEVNCEATGDPEPKIKWFKSMRPLELKNPRYSVLAPGRLQIKISREEDDGTLYSCMAVNEKGVVFSGVFGLYHLE
ncbi:tyrosine-protein phosphatase Lar-like [Oratosquilla oratoria]|uniref:tyrosine-protein phosphatase Lar-like n=1 Tax=Oratosquilla oratoria TaxID=337810 RepID=UPI003F770110